MRKIVTSRNNPVGLICINGTKTWIISVPADALKPNGAKSTAQNTYTVTYGFLKFSIAVKDFQICFQPSDSIFKSGRRNKKNFNGTW